MFLQPDYHYLSGLIFVALTFSVHCVVSRNNKPYKHELEKCGACTRSDIGSSPNI
jgi:hypothetical protein